MALSEVEAIARIIQLCNIIASVVRRKVLKQKGPDLIKEEELLANQRSETLVRAISANFGTF